MSNPPAFRRSEPDARRADLIAATARVLAREGTGGASVRAIAVEAGVSPGLVGHYFAGIDALIAATALTNGWALISKNQKDYRFIPDLLLPPYPAQ